MARSPAANSPTNAVSFFTKLRRSPWRWALLALVIVAFFWLQGQRPPQVKVARAARGAMQLTIAASGKVDGDAADLAFTGSGKLVALSAREGDAVEEGQVLARLNFSGGGSSDEVIQAPYAGSVITVYRKLGAVVAPGTPVLRVARRGGVYVTAYLDSEDAAWVRPGDRFTARAGGYLARAWNLKAQSVGREAVPRDDVEGSARQVRVRMTTTDAGFALPQGTALDIDGTVEITPDALQVPASAVTRQENRTFVWRVRGDTAQQAEVTLGPNNFRNVVIESGLAAGDEVVIEGKTGLQNGARVEAAPWEAPTP